LGTRKGHDVLDIIYVMSKISGRLIPYQVSVYRKKERERERETTLKSDNIMVSVDSRLL
jgi:UDP-glucose 4-epimerase